MTLTSLSCAPNSTLSLSLSHFPAKRKEKIKSKQSEKRERERERERGRFSSIRRDFYLVETFDARACGRQIRAMNAGATIGGLGGGNLRRGAFILFEGVDRCGKSTQCRLLVQTLQSRGIEAELWRYPDRTTAIGQMIDKYLQSQTDMDDASIHLLFSANRWEKR